MVTKYPIYKAVVTESEETGMFIVSLVQDPACDVSFLAFSKEDEAKPIAFQVEDEEQHIIKGVVMRCGYPILRKDAEGNPYYLIFDRETIELMSRKFFRGNYQENVDIQHSFNLIEGIEMQEMFISDKENGINPKGFEEIEDHSLFATYKVVDDELWNKVKESGYGFSLYGSFILEEDEEEKDYQDVMDMVEKLGNLFQNSK